MKNHDAKPDRYIGAEEVLDTYFRSLATGTRIRLTRYSMSADGTATTLSASYLKETVALRLVEGSAALVGDEYAVWIYPDELASEAMKPATDDLPRLTWKVLA